MMKDQVRYTTYEILQRNTSVLRTLRPDYYYVLGEGDLKIKGSLVTSGIQNNDFTKVMRENAPLVVKITQYMKKLNPKSFVAVDLMV
jgi:hypothetical protein